MFSLLSKNVRLVHPWRVSIHRTILSRTKPIAHLHHQGPSRSAVVHEQALPQGPTVQTPSFHSRPKTVPETTSKPPEKNPTNLETVISQIPLIQTLRNNPKIYKESRPHLALPPAIRNHHLVAGTLAGPGKLSLAPYIWTSAQERPKSGDGASNTKSQKINKVISAFHIGHQVCGHPGYVHGGLLTVLFDEVFARCASLAFPSGLIMTANLNVDFRKPALPDRIYVLRAKTTEVEGRKVWVEGRLTYLPLSLAGSCAGPGTMVDSDLLSEEDGVMVAEGKALFVEPKFAQSMVSTYKQ